MLKLGYFFENYNLHFKHGDVNINKKTLQNIDVDSSAAMSFYYNRTDAADDRLHNDMQQDVLYFIVRS